MANAEPEKVEIMDGLIECQKRRSSYTLYEKHKAIEKVEQLGIRGAARELKIPRKNFQRWMNHKEIIKKALATSRNWSKVGTPRRIVKQRANYRYLLIISKSAGKRVLLQPGKKIRRKAKNLFSKALSSRLFIQFKSWCQHMYNRAEWQCLPLHHFRGTKHSIRCARYIDSVTDFLGEMKSIDKDYEIIMNMDGTNYISMSNQTFYFKDVTTVNVKYTGNLRFICVLTAEVTSWR